MLGSPLNIATVILGSIFLMLLSDFLLSGLRSIPKPPVMALIVFSCRFSDEYPSFTSIVVFYSYFARIVSVLVCL